MLLAEVNLRTMGFSSMSLVMLRQRRGGAPPRDLESWWALTNHVLKSMSVGRLDVILWELSKERIALTLIDLLEKVIRKSCCGWSMKVRRRVCW